MPAGLPVTTPRSRYWGWRCRSGCRTGGFLKAIPGEAGLALFDRMIEAHDIAAADCSGATIGWSDIEDPFLFLGPEAGADARLADLRGGKPPGGEE